MRIVYWSLVMAGLVCFSVMAEELKPTHDEFEKTEVLDKPRYTLTGRFAYDLGLQFLPIDAYYKPILLEGAVAYQPFDWLSLEPVRFGWSLHNYNTGLTKSVENQVFALSGTRQALTSDQELKDLRFRAGSMAYFNLLYSKSNWFNEAIVYHYWQVGGGAMYYDMKKHHQIGGELALRVRFFVNNHWLFDLRGAHTLGFNSKAPKNISSLGLGVGFAF